MAANDPVRRKAVTGPRVTNILNLDERDVGEILTPRSDILFLDIREAMDRSRKKLSEAPYSVVPLCDGGPSSSSGRTCRSGWSWTSSATWMAW
jgi:Mg2+/Co2+ transporter CorB